MILQSLLSLPLHRPLLGVVVLTGVAWCFRGPLVEQIGRAVSGDSRWLEQRAIQEYVREMPSVDEVEILRIEEGAPISGLGTYTISNPRLVKDSPERMIVGMETFKGRAAQDLASQWRALPLTAEINGECFEPSHVLRFRSRGILMCESLVSFACENVALPSFPGLRLVAFDVSSPDNTRAQVYFQNVVQAAVSAPARRQPVAVRAAYPLPYKVKKR